MNRLSKRARSKLGSVHFAEPADDQPTNAPDQTPTPAPDAAAHSDATSINGVRPATQSSTARSAITRTSLQKVVLSLAGSRGRGCGGRLLAEADGRDGSQHREH